MSGSKPAIFIGLQAEAPPQSFVRIAEWRTPGADEPILGGRKVQGNLKELDVPNQSRKGANASRDAMARLIMMVVGRQLNPTCERRASGRDGASGKGALYHDS